MHMCTYVYVHMQVCVYCCRFCIDLSGHLCYPWLVKGTKVCLVLHACVDNTYLIIEATYTYI